MTVLWNFVNGSQPLDMWLLVIDSLKRKWVAKFVHVERLKECCWELQTDNNNCCYCVNPDFRKTPPTHWMLLPEDPQEESVKDSMGWIASMKTTQPEEIFTIKLPEGMPHFCKEMCQCPDNIKRLEETYGGVNSELMGPAE